MLLDIRKIVAYEEIINVEGGKKAPKELKLAGVAAVVKNPWFGKEFVEDLYPEINRISPAIGNILTEKLVSIIGSGAEIEAYGKAAVAGVDSEIEHASALIHTLKFGNFLREAVKAKSYLGFTNTRGPANSPIYIPLMDKNDTGRRSHYLTIQFSIADAPAGNELIAALGAAAGGRPHHRIGDRYSDLKNLGRDVDNPAGV
tara:strand:+ start:727 stop:1329 length:603 start_codon:yes stop_codon:yes gene_type:complete